MRMTKKAVNLSVDAELLAKAKEMELNLSATLEDVLREKTRAEEARRWKEENREAIEAFNRRIERDGIWSDGLRRF
ncbi:MAG: type II toxin-antitoxin system CcdA family antitoxin [Parvibaculum sp.]|nr:type II toxin-antitoxin system CcdA family antitoxin [Parvibaculum sp.]